MRSELVIHEGNFTVLYLVSICPTGVWPKFWLLLSSNQGTKQPQRRHSRAVRRMLKQHSASILQALTMSYGSLRGYKPKIAYCAKVLLKFICSTSCGTQGGVEAREVLFAAHLNKSRHVMSGKAYKVQIAFTSTQRKVL